MDRFTDLCLNKWLTPKVITEGNPYSHDYGPAYNKLFEGRTIKKVVEIGCGTPGLFHNDYVGGGSLFLWADLFPEARVYGLDIRADALVNPLSGPYKGRITSYLGDQSDVDLLRRMAALVGPGIDLFVDDGSHEWNDQVSAAEVFVPLLSVDGIYVIEDVRPGGDCSKNLGFEHEVIECRLDRVEDDRLIVIRAGAKRVNVLPA